MPLYCSCYNILNKVKIMELSNILERYSENTSSYMVSVMAFDSPVGVIITAGDEEFIYMVSFKDSKNLDKIFKTVSKELNCKFKEGNNKLLFDLKDDLDKYFDGKLKKFKTPIKQFGSDFQKEVWDMLCKQPYGTTQTYGELAKALGRSGSHARAIGAACGANAHLIVVPCHRIVATATKGGFSSGLDRKEWLLQHEEKYTTLII